MTPAGYIAKKVHIDAGWLKNPAVKDVCSVSNCISETFCDYIPHWKHNGYWLFDAPELISVVAEAAGVEITGYTIFYYEVHEQQYDADCKEWQSFSAEPELQTNVRAPAEKQLLGFDVVSFSTQAAPECSPLSCNGLAGQATVNRHCLFDTFEVAYGFAQSDALNNAEPGPYRIFAVYACGG